MKQFEALEIIQQSENFSRQLAQIETRVFTWADDKEKLYKAFFKQASLHKDMLESFPDEWFQASSNQFVAGSVFGSPARLHKFLYNNRDFLKKEEKSLIDHFMTNPWFYALFTIIDIFPDNILKAQDCSNGKEFYLYSAGTANLYKQGKNLFMSLLFDNGKCCQTYGLIHYYRGYLAQDFIGFAYLVSHHYRNSHDLSASIRFNAFEYMLLDRFAEIPVTMYKNEVVVFCAHSRPLASFEPADFKKQFLIEEKNNVIRCKLKKYERTMWFTSIYYDKKKGNLLLHATGLSRYQELVALLKDKVEFPQEPAWCFSAQMTIAVEKILGKKDPASVYDRYFDDASSLPKKNAPDLAPVNRLLQELTDYANTGRSYSLDELAARHDVPLETARQLEAIMINMGEKFKIELDGGFTDLVPPPPAQRDKFSSSINNSSLFTIQSVNEARIQALGLGLETQADFIRLLDDLYHATWEKNDYTVLNYTLYLLHIKGNRFEKAYDYACECLKIFWQILIPSQSKKHITGFIKTYEKFCRQVLFKTGLVEMEDHTAFRMRASELFYDLLKF